MEAEHKVYLNPEDALTQDPSLIYSEEVNLDVSLEPSVDFDDGTGNSSSELLTDEEEEYGSDYDSDDMDPDLPHAYCVNCTVRLYGNVCTCCGHKAVEDNQIFSTEICSTASSSPSNQTVLSWDERMMLHAETKLPPHPERPDRIRAVISRITASGLKARCRFIPCREATLEELLEVHTSELVEFLQTLGSSAGHDSGKAEILMSSDTYANSHTYLCARLAAGGAAEVAGAVARGDAPSGAAIIRPPGHHAESGMSMGFCFVNNAAIAAKAALANGAQRVLILDWDIHHGNGTQHIFENDNSVMYMSLHRYDRGTFYPGTGAATECGLGTGEGFTVNVPWDGIEMGNGDYMSAFTHVLVPIAYEFNPDVIIVSAGFDAADGDPIGQCRVTPECYGHMTALLKPIAPVVVLLEGGYNLIATATSTEACLRVLLGEQPGCLPGLRHASPAGWRTIQNVVQIQSKYWKSVQPTCVGCWLQSSYNVVPAPEVDETVTTVPATPSPEVSTHPKERKLSFTSLKKLISFKRRHFGNCTRKRQILMAIHRRTLETIWKRKKRARLT